VAGRGTARWGAARLGRAWHGWARQDVAGQGGAGRGSVRPSGLLFTAAWMVSAAVNILKRKAWIVKVKGMGRYLLQRGNGRDNKRGVGSNVGMCFLYDVVQELPEIRELLGISPTATDSLLNYIWRDGSERHTNSRRCYT